MPPTSSYTPFSLTLHSVSNSDSVLNKFAPFLQNNLFGGPGNWLPKSFLLNMSAFGLPTEIRDLDCMLLASKARVAFRTQINIRELGVEVGRSIIVHHSRHPENHVHDDWHKNTFVINLLNAIRDVQRMGFTPEDSLMQPSEVKKKHAGLQKRIYDIVAKSEVPSVSHAICKFRKRVDRWNFDIPKGHAFRRILARLKFLKGRVMPTVIVAYFKLVLNSWNTARRFRSCSTSNGPKQCVFCRNGQDSIEHFASCSRLHALFVSHGCRAGGLLNFFAIDQGSFPDKFIIKAKLIAAIYHAHCSLASARTPIHAERLLTTAVTIALNS